jgi:hypothetical protein
MRLTFDVSEQEKEKDGKKFGEKNFSVKKEKLFSSLSRREYLNSIKLFILPRDEKKNFHS